MLKHARESTAKPWRKCVNKKRTQPYLWLGGFPCFTHPLSPAPADVSAHDQRRPSDRPDRRRPTASGQPHGSGADPSGIEPTTTPSVDRANDSIIGAGVNSQAMQLMNLSSVQQRRVKRPSGYVHIAVRAMRDETLASSMRVSRECCSGTTS